MSPLPRRSGPALLLLVVLVAGCSGDPEAPGAGETSDTSDTGTPAGDPQTGEQSAAPTTDDAYADVAAEAITRVVGRDHTSYDADVEAAVPLLTDAFATTFRDTADSVRAAFVDARTTVSVSVRDAAVVSSGADGAQVLVLLDETSQQAAEPATTTPGAVLVEVVPVEGDLLVDGLSNDLSAGVPTVDPVRAEVERASRDLVTPLLNTSSDSLAEAVDASEVFTTRPLTGRLEPAVAPIGRLLGSSGGRLAGVAGSVAFQEVTETSATVLVAATVDLTRGDAEPERRTVRVRLELVPVDGTWRTRALTFYP